MKRAFRRRLFLAFALPLGVVLAWAVYGLPGLGKYPGPYGDMINGIALKERHVPNAVTAVNFDYRALDTLGEEFILFAAVTGVVILLRDQPGEQEEQSEESLSVVGRTPYRPSDAVQWLGRGMAGMIMLFGFYLAIHPQPSPGGGFQGGAMIGTATLLVCLASSHKVYGRIVRKGVADMAEAIGAGGYVLVGLSCLIAGGAFLQNFLPLGKPDSLLAGGTIPLINFCVALEVSAGFTVLFLEFFKEVRRPPPEQHDDQDDPDKPSPPSK